MSGTESNAKPLVSVIIPTYDHRARVLQSALASVYAQEGVDEAFDMEVIVVDNASSAPTLEVVRRYPTVRHLRLDTNRGLWVALNLGIKEARGKYVSFLIDDDLWLPHKLSIQVPVLEGNPEVGVVYSQGITVFGKDVSWGPAADAPSGWVFRDLLMGNFVGIQNHVIRRGAFEKAGCFDEGLSTCGEYDMWLRLAFHFPFTFTPGAVAIYLRSIRGMWSTDIIQRSTERELPMVLERALSMLDETAAGYAETRRQVLARAQLGLAWELESVGELERMRSRLVKVLAEFPWIAREPWARRSIVDQVRLVALTSASPIDAVRIFCAEVRAAVGGHGLRDRLEVRRLLADVWTEVAIGLRRRRTGSWHDRAAGYAAACAVLYNPAKLRRRVLPWLMVRGSLGPRWWKTEAKSGTS